MDQPGKYYGFACNGLVAVVIFLISGVSSFAAEHVAGRAGGARFRDGLYDDSLYLLDGTLSFSNGNGELQYHWRQLSGPPVVPATDFSSPKFCFRADMPGRYEFSLVVSANGEKSEPCVVTLLVENRGGPVPRVEVPPPIESGAQERWGIDLADSSSKRALGIFGDKRRLSEEK